MATEKTTGTAVKPEEATPEVQETARQRYDRSFAEMNPDVDVNDEEAYYDAKNNMIDELGKYRKNGASLRKAIDADSPFGEMMNAAVESGNGGKDFNPLKWYAQEKGADLKAILDDPEKADELMTAYNEGREKKAAMDKEMEAVKQAQTDGLQKIFDADKAKGVSEEQTQKQIAGMFDKLDAILKGDYLPFYEMMTRDASREEDITKAREDGRKEGVSTKVTEKLRTMNEQKERNAGNQEPVKEKPRARKSNNPFVV